MLEHLLDVKLAHWERATRELAGRALRRIARRDPAWTRDVALPALLTRALSPSLETRHGATVGAGEALLALRDAGEPLVDGQLAARARHGTRRSDREGAPVPGKGRRGDARGDVSVRGVSGGGAPTPRRGAGTRDGPKSLRSASTRVSRGEPQAPDGGYSRRRGGGARSIRAVVHVRRDGEGERRGCETPPRQTRGDASRRTEPGGATKARRRRSA